MILVLALAAAISAGSFPLVVAQPPQADAVALEHYLKARNTERIDAFGTGVAISALSPTQSVVIVGAPNEDSCASGVNGVEADNGCEGSGSAFAFACSPLAGGTCSQLAYLKASNTGASDNFGHAVAVTKTSTSECTVVIGAYNESSCATGVNGNQTDNGCSFAGSAYVFSCSTTAGCSQVAYLKGSITASYDKFGSAVAVGANSASETTVVIGAPGQAGFGSGLGRAYVFRCTTVTCTRQASLQEGSSGDNFGLSVDVTASSATDSAVVVGAIGENSGAGLAYVFACSFTACGNPIVLSASNPDAFDRFGNSVAISANSVTDSTVVVGAPWEDSCATGVNGDQANNSCSFVSGGAGSGYVFRCDATTCTQVAYLKATDTSVNPLGTDIGDHFGWSVAVSANSVAESTVVIGAPKEDSCATGVDSDDTNNDCRDAGSGYVFACNSTSCTYLAYLKASNTGSGDNFGWRVAVTAYSARNSTVVVGAYGENSCATGVDGVDDNNCANAGSAYVLNSQLPLTATGSTSGTGSPTTTTSETGSPTTTTSGTGSPTSTSGGSASTTGSTTGVNGATGSLSRISLSIVGFFMLTIVLWSC